MAKRTKNANEQNGLQPGDETVLSREDINHLGQGVGHINGLTVFTTNTIPGDSVHVRAIRRHPKYAVAELLRILQPAIARIEPDCPQADRCGSCTLQMMRYADQLHFKQQQVAQALLRIGHIELQPGVIQPIIGMDDPWHYRGKAQFPVGGSPEQPLIGYYASRTHEIVDAPVCRIQYPVVDAIRETLRQHIRTWQIEPYQDTIPQGLLRRLVVRIG